MPRLDLDPDNTGTPAPSFPREPARLVEILEAGINAAWAGAGTDTRAIEDATRALVVLREFDDMSMLRAQLADAQRALAAKDEIIETWKTRQIETQARMDKTAERLRFHVTTKPWPRASDLENAINDAYAYTQGKPGPCAETW